MASLNVKTELAALITSDLNFPTVKVYNSTQEALDNLERMIFTDYAVALGDMSEELDLSRPKGFTKRRVFVDVILVSKVLAHTSTLEVMQGYLRTLCNSSAYGNASSVQYAVRSHLLSWSPLEKFNNNVQYTIGTVELILFV